MKDKINKGKPGELLHPDLGFNPTLPNTNSFKLPEVPTEVLYYEVDIPDTLLPEGGDFFTLEEKLFLMAAIGEHLKYWNNFNSPGVKKSKQILALKIIKKITQSKLHKHAKDPEY